MSSANTPQGSADRAEELRGLIEELGNICENYPLEPGDTISHATAKECGRRGWAFRGWGMAPYGRWYPTELGQRVWDEHSKPASSGAQGEGGAS